METLVNYSPEQMEKAYQDYKIKYFGKPFKILEYVFLLAIFVVVLQSVLLNTYNNFATNRFLYIALLFVFFLPFTYRNVYEWGIDETKNIRKKNKSLFKARVNEEIKAKSYWSLFAELHRIRLRKHILLAMLYSILSSIGLMILIYLDKICS